MKGITKVYKVDNEECLNNIIKILNESGSCILYTSVGIILIYDFNRTVYTYMITK